MTTEFDPNSGSIVERALFNHRVLVVALCLLLTAILGWQATKLRLNPRISPTSAIS
jgi:predicted RND superfamily exporter protein